MTHDFAKKQKKVSKKSNAKPAKTKTQVPGWVWLLTGIATGVFISFLSYLSDVSPSSDTHEKTAKETKNKKTDHSTNTRFEFYTLLPEREVIVPVEEQQTDDKPQQQLIYILQAGSFKNAEDADRLRAKLILLGLDTKVEAVSGKGNDTWHRVQVGPFTSRSKLAKARSTLINNNIETLLLKRKVEG